MTDIATFGESMLRLSPPAGKRLESSSRLEYDTAGAESNVAVAAARLGAETAWLSKVPETALGRRVVGDVAAHGVEPAVVRSETGRQGTYYLEQGGKPRGTNVIYDRAGAAVTTATPSELDTDLVEEADVFFTTGITPALSETLYETTRSLLERGSTTAFDLNYRSKLWSPAEARDAFEELLPAVDVLFAPERDVRSVLGLDGDPGTLAGTLRSRYGCETVVLTRGAAGALARTAEGTLEQPAVEAETHDPVGTGDAFVGAYLARRVAGNPCEDALRWGAATAALCRTIAGDVALVSKSEVEAVLADEYSGIDR